jgi:hypothetical protein
MSALATRQTRRELCDDCAMKSSRSRVVVFVARWAIMSGLAGIVFAGVVFTGHDRAATLDEGERHLLLASALFISIAFILAPFVRRAFIPAVIQQPVQARPKTLLDEMRAGEAGDASTQPQSETISPAPSSAASRVLVGLYVVFAAVLVFVLWSL